MGSEETGRTLNIPGIQFRQVVEVVVAGLALRFSYSVTRHGKYSRYTPHLFKIIVSWAITIVHI
jgi:hypothetical protein